MGDVVLIEDKMLPKIRWRLGVVSSLLPSKDGYVRGCKLRVHDGKGGHSYLKRPVNQLCHFEVNSDIKNGEPKIAIEPRPRRKADVNRKVNYQTRCRVIMLVDMVSNQGGECENNIFNYPNFYIYKGMQ